MQQPLGFSLVERRDIRTLNLTLSQYQHDATGAMHFHFDAPQQTENVFMVALRTLPKESKGVALILEHTGLCGSERYPVRDPFFMMLRRSLNTFMNAFTSADWTAYPFATENKKDFDNLLDIYLDAVFFARLDELDFRQEGHRLELETPGDLQSDLVFKGVVFNEMKGAMSSPRSQLWHRLTHYLFPSTTYHYNSGGEPADIPDLSYAQLKDFYTTHYHPSNAIFMTFGDIPAQAHQAVFQQRVLQRFEPLAQHWSVAAEKRYASPLRVTEHYPFEEDDTQAQTHIVIGWLLGDSADLFSRLEAQLLSDILLGNSAAPLRKALENSELAKAPSSLCGLSDSSKEMMFVCGVEGSEPQQIDAVEQLIVHCLQQVAQQGVEEQRIEAVLHQIELGQREIRGDSYPYGLQLMLEVLGPAVHRANALDALDLDPALQRLRQQIQQPDYIPQLIHALLLNNRHRVTLALQPDQAMGQVKQALETQRLAAIKAQLDPQQLQQIDQQARALQARQAQQDDQDCLPKLELADVPAQVKYQAPSSAATAAVKHYASGTNGISYVQLVHPLPALSIEQLQLLPLYCDILTELGIGNDSYLTLQDRQSACCGGIHAFTSIHGEGDHANQLQGALVLSSKALNRNVPAMVELLLAYRQQARFDEHERIADLLAQTRLQCEQSITGSGHSLAMLSASQGLSQMGRLNQLSRGLDQIAAIITLDKRMQQRGALAQLAEQLQQLHHHLMQSTPEVLVVSEAEQADTMLAAVRPITAHAYPSQPQWLDVPCAAAPIALAWEVNTQINFCAKAYAAVTAEHDHAAALTVLAGVLRNECLHRLIREQGGAYGGGASYDASSASFRFYSYRDPRIEGTLKDFDTAIDWALTQPITVQMIEQAILGAIGSMDKPGSPAGEAKRHYYNDLFGRTLEKRLQFRQRLLAITPDALRQVAQQYLTGEAQISVVTYAQQRSLCQSLGLTTRRLQD